MRPPSSLLGSKQCHICRLCEQEQASVRAHIIPRSFFLEHKDEGKSLKPCCDRQRTPTRREVRLEFTIRIFFAPAVRRDSRHMTHTDLSFFILKAVWRRSFPDTEGEANIVRCVDYKLLKLFILSVLWRASVSGQTFYAGVKLGPYEDALRSLILADNPGEAQDFPIMIHRFSYPSELIPILCPVSSRISGLNFYQLLLNGFLALVKVDRQSLFKAAI